MYDLCIVAYGCMCLGDMEGDGGGGGAEEPWLDGVELALRDSPREATKDLDGDDGRVLHEVLEDLTMDNLDGTVIAGGGEEGMGTTVEGDGTDGLLMGLEDTVGLGGGIQIVPQGLCIVRTDNQMVTKWVHIQARE